MEALAEKKIQATNLSFTPLPARIVPKGFITPALACQIARKATGFLWSEPVVSNYDSQTEDLAGVTLTHNFLQIEGRDRTNQRGQLTRYHVVSAGQIGQPTILFLHGLPDSWFMWQNQLHYFAKAGYRVVAPDLRGYGQTDKKDGDYHPKAIAYEIQALCEKLGITKTIVVTHDRGTVIADHLTALAPELVAGYVRGEQHLYHFNPVLTPQEELFRSMLGRILLRMPMVFCLGAYQELGSGNVAPAFLKRTIAEFNRPGIAQAIGYYFRDSSFIDEWLDRRHKLIEAWQCKVLALQGRRDPKQPFEFYSDLSAVDNNLATHIIEAGHFLFPENPTECNRAILNFISSIEDDPC